MKKWYVRSEVWPADVLTWLLATNATHALKRARQLCGHGIYVSSNGEPAVSGPVRYL